MKSVCLFFLRPRPPVFFSGQDHPFLFFSLAKTTCFFPWPSPPILVFFSGQDHLFFFIWPRPPFFLFFFSGQATHSFSLAKTTCFFLWPRPPFFKYFFSSLAKTTFFFFFSLAKTTFFLLLFSGQDHLCFSLARKTNFFSAGQDHLFFFVFFFFSLAKKNFFLLC